MEIKDVKVNDFSEENKAKLENLKINMKINNITIDKKKNFTEQVKELIQKLGE